MFGNKEEAIHALLNFLNNRTSPRRESLAALDSQWAMNLVPMIVESLSCFNLILY